MPNTHRIHTLILICATIFGSLYLASCYSYLFSHTLAEVFSVAVAIAIFMLVWNLRRSIDNAYLLFVGIAYLFVGSIDLIHTFAYNGMALLRAYGPNLQAQFWIAGRYMESVTLLIACFFIGRKLKPEWVFLGYLIVTIALFGAIFYWHVFPAGYELKGGITPFNRFSELIICLITVAVIPILVQKRSQFDPAVLRFLVVSIVFAALSELCFSFYIDVYGFIYLLGHFFKILSFYCIYRTIIELGISKPLDVLFRNLKNSEQELEYQVRERTAELEDHLLFEKLLSALSARLINAELGQIDHEITEALAQARKLYGFECLIFQEKSDEGEFPQKPRIVCASGDVPADIRENVADCFPWVDESRTRQGNGHSIIGIGNLPAAAKQAFEKLGFTSCLAIPIIIKGTVRHVLCVASKGDHHDFPEKVIQRLRLLGEILSSALERKRTGQALLLEQDKFKSILNAIPDGVYIVNHLYQVEYANPVIEKRLGPVKDQKCYAYFHGRTGVCPWCRNPDVFDGKKVQWEWQQEETGKTYDIFEVPIPSASGIVSKLKIMHDVTERKQAEKSLRESERQLRSLSSRLLTAQETERRRISQELHDELGGALAVLKLRSSLIEKKLSEEQAGLKDECKENMGYIDQIIDNVHRISRALSPSILEDIGIAAALQWMINNFIKHYHLQALTDIPEIDHLFTKNDQFMIYRVFQEALTNIGKHAHAGTVSLSVHKDEDQIRFCIKDNGRGFDVTQVSVMKASEKGLGLATMDERARILGGTLDIWSQPGDGTRITLNIPVKRHEGDGEPPE